MTHEHSPWSVAKHPRAMAAIAAACFVAAGWVIQGDPLRSLGGVLVLAGGVVAVIAIDKPAERSRARRYGPMWREVCHVLGSDHIHEGTKVRGTWNGRPFRAFAQMVVLGEYGGTIVEYKVIMASDHTGPAWKAKRAGGERVLRGPQAWTLRADRLSTEERLVDAGLLAAIGAAEQTAKHFRRGVRLSYDPRENEVVYEDKSGAVPCADDLVVHLELVRRAAEINAVAAQHGVAEGAHGTIRPRLRIEGPPLWTMTLWFPAAMTCMLTIERWPWSFALFPAAFVVPLVGSVRIGRR